MVQKGSEGATKGDTPVSQSDGRAAAETAVEGSKDWQMGNAGAEKAATMAGGGVEDGPKPKSRNVVGVTERVAEDGKAGGASSGLRIARTVGPTEVAAIAQQGEVAPLAHSDVRTAATTRIEEGSEGTTEVAATARQGAGPWGAQ